MPESLVREFHSLLDEKLDVQDVVCEAQKLLHLSRPVAAVYTLSRHIVCWEKPYVCVALLLTCNIFCIFLPLVYMAVFVLGILGLQALLGLSNRRCRLLVKVLPSLESPNSCDLGQDTEAPSHHECMQEFRLLLILLHVTLKWCSASVNGFYALLKWDDLMFSLKWYSMLCSLAILLYLVPLRFVWLLCFNLLLLRHPLRSCVRKLKETDDNIEQTEEEADGDVKVTSDIPILVAEDTVSQQSDIQADAGIGTESEISDSEIPRVPDESSSADEMEVVTLEQVSSSSSSDVTEQKQATTGRSSGVVGRILELKKRRQQLTEKCAGCSVVFTTILKRRHTCSSCGNHFCSRCCSYKVPRSIFGATAPVAQTETVAVCRSCFAILTNTSDKLKTS